MADDSGFTLAVFQQHVNFQQAINIVAKTNINGLNVPVRLQHDVKRIDQDIIFHLVAFAWYTLTQIESCSGCMVEYVSTLTPERWYCVQ